MGQIIIDKECGCFKKSGMKNNIDFSDKTEALKIASGMIEDMNDTWCQRHIFSISETDDNIIINRKDREV